jgi:hypothetical protein
LNDLAVQRQIETVDLDLSVDAKANDRIERRHAADGATRVLARKNKNRAKPGIAGFTLDSTAMMDTPWWCAR